LDSDGAFWGIPPDSETAIKELESMRQEQGANFIAFGWPSFWWFDHYKVFPSHLRNQYNCVFENDHLVIFDVKRTVTHCLLEEQIEKELLKQ